MKETVEDLFYQIQAGQLSDAKETISMTMAERIQAKLVDIKKQIAGSLYKESVEFTPPTLGTTSIDEGCIAEKDKLAAAQEKAKSVPKKAPKLKDGNGEIVDEFKTFKEDLNETHKYAVYVQRGDKLHFVESHQTMDGAKDHAKRLNSSFGNNRHRAAERKSVEAMSTFVKESLDEARKDVNAGIYHDTYRSALEHAYGKAKEKGYDIHDEDYHKDTTFVDPKPAPGKTKSLHFPLSKNGVVQKKQMHVQVYNRGQESGSKYELNHYIS